MLKFVLDTNVLVSAMISTGGNPALLLDKAGEGYSLFISRDMLIEFEAVISRDKFGFTDEETNTIIEAVISVSEVVNPEITLDVIRFDPDDNKILECAVACKASHIVSGDRHLLDLKEYGGICCVA